MTAWLNQAAVLNELAARTLFFIGGPPRSGTTWVQRIADAHPRVSCRGEGLFQRLLAGPIDGLYQDYAAGLTDKNNTLFRDTGGYPLPEAADADHLLGAAVLLALRRQGVAPGTLAPGILAPGILAVGEKTPENVFLFPRLKRLFPGARFIGVARDPRDVVASAWRQFGQAASGADPGGQDDGPAKAAFAAAALPQISRGLEAMIALERHYGDDCLILTYEQVLAEPHAGYAALYRFLGVDDGPDRVAAGLAATRRTAEVARGDRDGVLTPALRDLAVRETGWAFQRFGWRS
jgi:hypothetical protein